MKGCVFLKNILIIVFQCFGNAIKITNGLLHLILLKIGIHGVPIVRKKKLDISVAQELAHAKNGKCISEKYINNSSPLLWECANKHKFHLSLGDVKNQGSWCRECMKLGLEFAQNLANERGGMCLSSS